MPTASEPKGIRHNQLCRKSTLTIIIMIIIILSHPLGRQTEKSSNAAHQVVGAKSTQTVPSDPHSMCTCAKHPELQLHDTEGS